MSSLNRNPITETYRASKFRVRWWEGKRKGERTQHRVQRSTNSILELVLDFNLINRSTFTTKVVTHHDPLHFRPESPKYNDIMDVYDKRQAVDIPEHLREGMSKCAHNSVSGRVFQQWIRARSYLRTEISITLLQHLVVAWGILHISAIKGDEGMHRACLPVFPLLLTISTKG